MLFTRKTPIFSNAKEIGLFINPYCACAANKIINNEQHAIEWHGDEATSAHAQPKTSDDLSIWCISKQGSEYLGHAAVNRNERRDYLGMNLDCARR